MFTNSRNAGRLEFEKYLKSKW